MTLLPGTYEVTVAGAILVFWFEVEPPSPELFCTESVEVRTYCQMLAPL